MQIAREAKMKLDETAVRILHQEYERGASLRVLADGAGISKEWLSTLFKRHGLKVRPRGKQSEHQIDLQDLLMAYLPDKSIAQLTEELGLPASCRGQVRRMLKSRNLTWKKTRGRYTDTQLLDLLRGLASRLGRAPTLAELGAEPRMPAHTTFALRFGSYNKAQEAAGLMPHPRGGRKQ